MSSTAQLHSSSLPHPSPRELSDRHRDSMLASLNRRLEVARQSNNLPLIDLLQQEQQQLVAGKSGAVWLQRLQTWWKGMADAVARSTQLQISEMQDEAGNRWWHAYDPNTGQRVYTDSETEIMLWVEQHYRGR